MKMPLWKVDDIRRSIRVVFKTVNKFSDGRIGCSRLRKSVREMTDSELDSFLYSVKYAVNEFDSIFEAALPDEIEVNVGPGST